MSSFIQKLNKNIVPPLSKWVVDSSQYEVMMGSVAYGVSDTTSDMDIYAMCIPAKEMIFPHLAGEIVGFGTQKKRFEQEQRHHILINEKNYDICSYSIVKYFNILLGCNPNVIDSMYVPQRCVLYISPIGQYMRENRQLFLTKKCFHTMKGYAYSQKSRLVSKNAQPGGKREKYEKEFHYDLKFAYHLVRLLNQAEQIMVEYDLDLERNREQLKSIRRGEWTLEDIHSYFDKKERELETLYTTSKIPYAPDEKKIKQILLHCLEMHFGSLEKCISNTSDKNILIKELEDLIEKYK